ncbi:creatininase family protein [Aerococcaceae bacterium WGS1372]
MKLRSHFLNALVNSEVEEYLKRNDTIIVPFGPTELHGGMPLDCETVLSEALALILAERANSLILPHIPYIYSGATASAKGTIQLTVRESSNMLHGIAKSLLQSGFKKQIYISLHGPSHISMGLVVRDFFDETGTSILYIDGASVAQKSGVFGDMKSMIYNFDCMIVASYKLRNRIDDILLTSEFEEPMTNSSAEFGHLKSQSYESGATGYYFKELTDHRATTAIPDIETRNCMADEGLKLLNQMADVINIQKIIEEMDVQTEYLEEVFNLYPNTPAAFNRKHN